MTASRDTLILNLCKVRSYWDRQLSSLSGQWWPTSASWVTYWCQWIPWLLWFLFMISALILPNQLAVVWRQPCYQDCASQHTRVWAWASSETSTMNYSCCGWLSLYSWDRSDRVRARHQPTCIQRYTNSLQWKCLLQVSTSSQALQSLSVSYVICWADHKFSPCILGGSYSRQCTFCGQDWTLTWSCHRSVRLSGAQFPHFLRLQRWRLEFPYRWHDICSPPSWMFCLSLFDHKRTL